LNNRVGYTMITSTSRIIYLDTELKLKIPLYLYIKGIALLQPNNSKSRMNHLGLRFRISTAASSSMLNNHL
jgi:hypothetical protein